MLGVMPCVKGCCKEDELPAVLKAQEEGIGLI